MKRILIFSHAMELGGAERALLGLLENFDYKKYQVDLFLMRHSGELMAYIPSQVNLLPELPQYASLAVPFSTVIKNGQLLLVCGRLYGKYAAQKRVKQLELPEDNGVALEYSHKYTKKFMPSVGYGQYDLAISFLTPHYFVAEKVSAKRKIAWIHTDYSKVSVDVSSELRMWNKYERIISISDSVTDSFLKLFPSLKEKIRVIENMMPTKCINVQKNMLDVSREMPEDGSIKLLSIGRFCTAKNFDNIPAICSLIREQNYDIKWYIIGFGGDKNLIEKRISEFDMQDYVIILGKKENPYPYINACDLYVQPSRYEGNSVTVHEAQLLEKPVVITDYATSCSQLEDGVDGVIVPMDNEGCAQHIASLLRNPERCWRLSENCRKRDYSYGMEIEKVYALIP